MNVFSEFEHEGWQRVAGKCDSNWASSTRQFIPPLLNAADVIAGMAMLDVGCGPGYLAAAATERGAAAVGLDFSAEMIAIARRMFPHIQFREGDARPEGFCEALTRAGFDGGSMKFQVHTIEWQVPTVHYIFVAECNAGVLTAGGFAIPQAVYIVSISK